MTLQGGTLAALLASLLACTAGSPLPGVEAGEARAARGLGERWIEQLQGFDALEAYELRLDESSLGFAVARQHRPGEVRVLAYVVRPRHLDEVALLARLRVGAPLEVLSYVTPQLYGSGLGARQAGSVARVPSLSQGLRLGAAAAVAFELIAPLQASDYRFERLPDRSVAGELCSCLRVAPRADPASSAQLELAISQRTGVALERVTRAADGRELQRVEVAPADVIDVDDRFVPVLQRVRSADGSQAELRLVNAVRDVELPDSLFTSRSLQQQKFPSF